MTMTVWNNETSEKLNGGVSIEFEVGGFLICVDTRYLGRVYVFDTETNEEAYSCLYRGLNGILEGRKWILGCI